MEIHKAEANNLNVSMNSPQNKMIETTLSTEFSVGTNLQGDMVSADWRFLLPRLRMRQILCLGVPASSNIMVLSTIGDKVVIASDETASLDSLKQNTIELGVSNLALQHLQEYNNLPFEAGEFSLIYLATPEVTRQFLSDTGLQQNLACLLDSAGILHYEVHGYRERRQHRAAAGNLQKHGLAETGLYWLTPFKGEMRTALPADDGVISDFFFQNVMFGQSFRKRMLSLIGRRLSQSGAIGKVMPRRAVFLQKSEEQQGLTRLPKFLLELAQKENHDFNHLHFGLSTRGKYNANKVIYYLFEDNARLPTAIVKMTRSADFNYRLQNEYRSLKKLVAGNFVRRGTYPEPLFFGAHNGLAVLAQKAVHGAPFRTQTTAEADCPLAKDAVEWLMQLGRASANSELVSASEAAAAIGVLYERFRQIYHLNADEALFMNAQIDMLKQHGGPFPLVFQHGDPGTWNILVGEDRRVIFIDWEAGEPHGIPLWDIFYFMRTFASWVARQQGSADALKNFRSSFLTDSPFTKMLQGIVRRYCDDIGLPEELVQPLFYTCWMHRSLKEAARLTPTTLRQGHYFNLLKLCINERGAIPLQGLWAPGKTSSANVQIC